MSCGRRLVVVPTRETLVRLVSSLLQNARDLSSDARLLHENGRHARSYALAALAGEEVGKIELCLDLLLGAPVLTEKEFRRGWSDHSGKLVSVIAYRAAFIDDPSSIALDSLRAEPEHIARRKMDAIYVDFRGSEVRTPAVIGEDEAAELIGWVENAVAHASDLFGPVTQEVVEAINEVAPHFAEPLTTLVEGLDPETAATELRELMGRAQQTTDADWASAIAEGRVDDLLHRLRTT